MQINLEANLMWEAVEGNPSSMAADKAALAALLRSVPPEMVGALAVKGTAKAAWDAVKIMRVGVNRVREATAQRLRKEFEAITFLDGESLDKFGLRIMSIVNNLRSLGDTVEEIKVVQKILRVVPDQYSQMACSIETLLDLSTVSVEELLRRLRSSEGRGGTTTTQNPGGILLLTEEEWEARRQQREQGQGSGGNGNGRKKGKPKTKNGRNGNGGRGNGERDMSQVKCYNCNNMGHFSKNCPEPRRERRERANLAQDQEEEQALLMATVGAVTLTSQPPRPIEHVLLNEKRSKASATDETGRCDTSWFLDSGASNHMCGRRDFFSELDTSVHGFVKLGDDTSVEIEGRGTILFTCKSGEHLTLSEVYFIPKLCSSIVSLGQLDEIGYDTRIHHGWLQLRDADGRLLAHVPRSRGRLYVLHLAIARPVCLAAHGGEDAWRWHARYGHMHFDALRHLARGELVHGLPLLDEAGRLCDACLAGKQKRAPFPRQAVNRADELLGLVHADLCGPIDPPTPGGKRYFLLLVDDHSRHMWIHLLAT
jgi:hypothetical protein